MKAEGPHKLGVAEVMKADRKSQGTLGAVLERAHPMATAEAQVTVFAKRPLAGEVKTRLAAEIGGEAAAQVYRELLAGVIRELSASIEWDFSLAVTPDDALQDDEAWPPGALRRAQGGGDLGERLERALAEATPARPVLVVGSDVPGLSAAAARAALDGLAGADVVLGPAPDGGYWAIGTRCAGPAGWLAGVRWSTLHARQDTLDCAAAVGLEAAVLDLWLEDVDDLASYRRWRGEA